MPGQESLVDCVVNNFDLAGIDSEQLLDFTLGKSRHREDAGRVFQYSSREMKMEKALDLGSATGAVKVVKQVVRGQHIRTRQPAREPVQMRNVGQVAIEPFNHRSVLHFSTQGVGG